LRAFIILWEERLKFWATYLLPYMSFSQFLFSRINFQKKIKQFEKFRYLAAMFILLLAEITVIGTALPDFD